MKINHLYNFLFPHRMITNFSLLIFACLLLFAHPLTADYQSVYTINTNGGISFTGNTLGLNKASNQNNPGTSGSIGAFLTTDTESKVGSYPSGTTLNWENNSSSAVLDIPANSTILHAELIWSGSYGFGDTVPLNSVDVPITLITPDNASHVVSPNPATAKSRVQSGTTGFYVRSADVTSLVSGGGTYTVGGVPATVAASENNLNCAGWTLAVAYSNGQMLTSNLTIFVACEASGAPPALVNGFHAPSVGNIVSVLFSSCLEGDAQLVGDHFLISDQEPLVYPADAISGPNNPANNFFGSQINTNLALVNDPVTGKLVNNGSATLDTRGTSGSVNSNIVTGTAVSGARQGYDITAIDVGSLIVNDQVEFYAQGTTDQDVYTVNSMGVQIQVLAPLIQSVLTVDQSTITLGSTVTYTSTFTNVGEATAEELVFKDILPSGLTFVPGSLSVNNVNVPSANIVTGVSLGDVAVNGSVIVVFQAQVTQFNPPNTFDNFSYVDYTFTPLDSTAPTVNLSSQTNTVQISGAVVPPPVANPDTATTGANIVLTGLNVMTNDTGANITVTSYTTPSAGGSVVVQPNGVYTYNPPVNFSGTDAFNYTITDTLGETSSSTVTITVVPIALGDSATVASNTLLTQNTSVLVNDIGSNLTISTFDSTSGQGGTVVMQTDGTYTYISAQNYSGIDNFNYTAIDSSGNTVVGVVTIRVLPLAENDFGSTSANTTLNGSTVFTNDVGTGLTLVAYDHESVQGGQVTMNMEDGTYVYQPPTNYSGTDTFTYTVEDESGEETVSTVTITVLPVAVLDTGTTNANVQLNQITSVLSNDLGSNLTIQSYNVNTVQGGTIVMQTNGTYVYTPPTNYSGPDAFNYVLEDTIGSTANGHVNLTVLPVANPNTGNTTTNTVLIGASVLNDDAGSQLMIQTYQESSTQGGTVVMNVDGTYTYTPPANFSGTDTFSYTAIDFYGNTATATVTISISPDINDESYTTQANLPVSGNLLDNDSGSGLTVTPFTQTTSIGGIVTVASNGDFTYVPPYNFSGTDSFTYIVTDSSGNTSTATATITVLPVAINDTGSTSTNIPLNGSSVFANDHGSNLSIFSYTSGTSAGGHVVMNTQTGTYTYYPPAGFVGTDSFTYTLVDGEGNQSTATVFISVHAVSPPTDVKGTIKKTEFLNKNEDRLTIKWDPSPSPDIVKYRIYYKKKLIAEVPANQPLFYRICLRSAKDARNYYITAVNLGGAESAPINIRIRNG